MPEVEERRGSGAALRCFLDVLFISDAAHYVPTTLRPRYECHNERMKELDFSEMRATCLFSRVVQRNRVYCAMCLSELPEPSMSTRFDGHNRPTERIHDDDSRVSECQGGDFTLPAAARDHAVATTNCI